MVADQQEAALARDLFQTRHIDVDAAQCQRNAAELVEEEPEIAARLFQQLFRVDKQTRDEHDQQKQHHERQKAAEEKHGNLPHSRKRGKAGRGIRQRAAGEQRKREEHIEHDE